MLILIPAYEPDLRLVTLIRDLGHHLPDARVLVVDDGSGAAFDGVFEVSVDAGATVVRLPHNRGKGAALKVGFAWAAEHSPGEDVVCADCDGQHTPADIARVAAAVAPDTMALGGRRFTGDVPARSRFGNTVSRWAFRAVSGSRVHDTQTGLRAYPAGLLGWLQSVPGERFEYEFNLLLQARSAGVGIIELPIETIYLDENSSSHFRPVRDSLRIYAPVLRFAASSVGSFLVDAVVLWLTVALTGHLLVSVVLARLVSGVLNYRWNARHVFGSADTWRTRRRYLALAVALLAGNYLLLHLTTVAWGWPLLVAKVAVEATLFAVSYVVQHRAVFARRTRTPRPLTASAARTHERQRGVRDTQGPAGDARGSHMSALRQSVT